MEHSSKFLTLAFFLIFVSLPNKQTFAATYIVGGSSEWDPSADFESWASSNTFKVGDELEFKYTPMHSVMELPNEDAFKKCSLSNPLKLQSTGTTGDEKIKLGSAGTRYFACGTTGHCEQGMKVQIKTVAAGGSSSTPSTTTKTPSSPGTAPSTTSASSHQVQFIGFFALVASLVVSFI